MVNAKRISACDYAAIIFLVACVLPAFAGQRIEAWETSKWYSPTKEFSSLSIDLVFQGEHVCGTLISTAKGQSHVDRSILFGRRTAEGAEVQYASSYYIDQTQLAHARLSRIGKQLRWQPHGADLPQSWHWSVTTLPRTAKPSSYMNAEVLTRCKSLQSKTILEAKDLFLEP